MNYKKTFPTPLESSYWWNPGTWWLPSITLTIASMFIFFGTIAYLTHDKVLRKIFTLPINNNSVLTVVALCIVVILLFLLISTRNRPCNFKQGAWVVFLFIFALLVLTIQFVKITPIWWQNQWGEWRVFRHSTLFACLGATLTLLPRFYKPRIDSSFIQFVSPVTVLLLIPLLSYIIISISENSFNEQKIRIEKIIAEQQSFLHTLKNILEPSSTSNKFLKKTVALKDILERDNLDREIIDTAEIIGNEDKQKLLEFSEEKIDLFSAHLKKNDLRQAINKISRFAFYDYDEYRSNKKVKGVWKKNKEMEDLAENFIGYYKTVNDYIYDHEKFLNSLSVNDAKELEKKIQEVKTSVQDDMSIYYDSWSKHWLRTVFPNILNNEFTDDALIDHLIETPFIVLQGKNNTSHSLTLSNIHEISELIVDLKSSEDYLENDENNLYDCYADEFKRKKIRYTTFVCYSYGSSTNPSKIDPILELRLVYEKSSNKLDNLSIIIPSEFTLNIDSKLFRNRLHNIYNPSIKLNTKIISIYDGKKATTLWM